MPLIQVEIHPLSVCKSGYAALAGSCVWLNPTPDGWLDQANICHSDDAYMVTINSQAKSDAIHAFVTALHDNQPGTLSMLPFKQ